MIISISGPDGSGKSTLSKKLYKKILKSGKKAKLFHISKYFLLEPFLRIVRGKVSEGERLGYKKRGDFTKFLTFLTIFDVWVHFIYLAILSIFGYTVICDRYFYDRAVGYYLHGYFSKKIVGLYLVLTPNSDLSFLIKLSPKESLVRESGEKHDLKFHKKISYSYNLLPKSNFFLLDGAEGIGKLAHQMWERYENV